MAWEYSTSDGHHGIQQHLVIELDATGHRWSSMAWQYSTSDGHHGIQQQHLVIGSCVRNAFAYAFAMRSGSRKPEVGNRK